MGKSIFWWIFCGSFGGRYLPKIHRGDRSWRNLTQIRRKKSP